MLKRPFRLFGLIALVWFLGNLAAIFASWGRAYLTPIDAVTQTASVDLRTDKSVAGRDVFIIGTKPTPSKGDYIGHMWVAWPQTPPLAPAGSKEGGYYANSHPEAIAAMAKAVFLPWGFVTGQEPVGGHMKVDDGWWRHKQVRVTVDEDRYQAALKVDSRWRNEKIYILRPSLKGMGEGRTRACQDYVLDVADALGLKTGKRNWTQFPMGSFLDFIRLNDITVTAPK